MYLTQKQKDNLQEKRTRYENMAKPAKEYTSEEIVLNFLAESPDTWFYTWDLAGPTKWGFLSHATHATLRKAEQKGLIIKDYVGKYVVYTYKHKDTLF